MGVYVPNIKKPKHCTECYFVSRDQCELQDNSYDYETFKEQRKHCPLIEIVRCGECKHQVKQWHEDNRRKDKGYYIYWCDRNEDPFVAHTVSGEPTDFCSYGERRADVK